MESLSKPEKGWQIKANLAAGTAGGSKRRGGSRRGATTKEIPKIGDAFPEVPPKNPMAFERDWRRHCISCELKLKYLTLCGPAVLRRIFKTEMDVSLISQVIIALAETATTHSVDSVAPDGEDATVAQQVFSVLNVLPETGRFSLNIQFMDSDDKESIGSVLSWLEAAASEKGEGGNIKGEQRSVHFSAVAVGRLRRKYSS